MVLSLSLLLQTFADVSEWWLTRRQVLSEVYFGIFWFYSWDFNLLLLWPPWRVRSGVFLLPAKRSVSVFSVPAAPLVHSATMSKAFSTPRRLWPERRRAPMGCRPALGFTLPVRFLSRLDRLPQVLPCNSAWLSGGFCSLFDPSPLPAGTSIHQ